jgi:hypothetical protein
VVENEAPEDVKGLPGVRKSAGVVREEAGSVIVKFCNGFAQEHKRPGDRRVAVSFPFIPNALESLLSFLGHGAIEKTVLRGFFGP